ncbi:type III secretion system inner membrane ring subunit SctD [Hahella aquimaris]|uniref:type III secretion system inner membrane ring subunit SctD n=1 Tax=Hahella sp. HNIBRBA332 TaxID=3015983 RepID=UPI00273AEF23|nr:type III secretion system inner membrane ring subunit SctD [Hahella sp. HNIBRBA332]WLQ16241.1 type III secretion system inner membrane ring subunit SctD [Hahella sp. HNIBRBA332]
MTSAQWMIKLLSGPHAGAEMRLENRTYRVGSADDCDIVLHDKLLPDLAFTLCVGMDGVRLQREGENETSVTLLCEGRESDDPDLLTDAYSVYSLGMLHFCFGPAHQRWPDISLPTPYHAGETNPSNLPAAAESEHSQDAMGKRQESGRSGLSRRSRLMLNLPVFMCFIIGGVIFNSRFLDAGVIPPEASLDLAGIVAHDWRFEGLAVNPQTQTNGANKWLISGYVDTAAQAADLKRRLQALNALFELDIRVMESVKRSTETLLQQFQLSHLTVSLGDQPGELVISGVEANLDNWLRQKELLLADIPGLTHIQDRVERPESRLNQLKQWLQEEGLDKQVLVNAQDGRLSITSDIRLEESEAWRRVQRKFQERFGGALEAAVIANARPALAIRSVSLGAVPHLVLANGRRYGLGAHVSDGYFLEQVAKDAVVLRRGEELIKYRVGSGADASGE